MWITLQSLRENGFASRLRQHRLRRPNRAVSPTSAGSRQRSTEFPFALLHGMHATWPLATVVLPPSEWGWM